MRRRKFLAVLGVASAGVTGGCSNTQNSEPSGTPEVGTTTQPSQTETTDDESALTDPIYDSPVPVSAVDSHLKQIEDRQGYSIRLYTKRITDQDESKTNYEVTINSDGSRYVKRDYRSRDIIEYFYRTQDDIIYHKKFFGSGTRYYSEGCKYTSLDFAHRFGLIGGEIHNTRQVPSLKRLIQNIGFTHSESLDDSPGGGVNKPVTRDLYTAYSVDVMDKTYLKKLSSFEYIEDARSILSIRKNGLFQGVYLTLTDGNSRYQFQGNYAGENNTGEPEWLPEAKLAIDGKSC